VYYQPIVRVRTGKICGYEALARWIDDEMGYLPPRKFINTLEEYHLIQKVDTYIIEQVCKDLRRLIDAGEDVVPVSVNLSRLDFELCDIFGLTEACRQKHGIAPNMLDIEITESALNDSAEHLKNEIRKFREAGYHIWIDDFGSGYSSLNNLLDYEFDVLKLDMEFMRTYDEHPQASELIKNIVKSGRDLGVEPLQEGVERQEHVDFLKSIDCERMQGYFFAKPMSLDESRRTTLEKGLSWE
jgi:EAL domain-containing protein (putative c-di-GMP-specific phosphodiesterase class I)